MCCDSCDRKESDMAERLNWILSTAKISKRLCSIQSFRGPGSFHLVYLSCSKSLESSLFGKWMGKESKEDDLDVGNITHAHHLMDIT